ncbi:MAG: ATP-binding protein [Candidatus Competibacteraceae bacterium]
MRFENMALRREAEEQSTLLETTLHSMEQGISLVDRDGRLRLWNPHFLDLLGLSQVDMGDPPHLPLIIQAADPPLQLYNGRTEYRRADGAIIEIRQRPMPDGGRVLTYTDISLIAERTEALLAANQELNQRHGQLEQAYQQLAHTQEQLIQSAKMASLGFLVAGVAHELNNPISFVHGNLEFIGEYTDRLARVIAAYSGAGQDDSPSRRTGDRQRDHLKVDATLDTLRELIASCQEGTERVKKIILDLRLFSRADATGPVLTDLHAGIEFTLTLLAKEYRDRLTVHRDYGALPRVECYAGQINQVFMNLLQNAAQAIPAKGDIWIKTALAGDRVTIAIRDNGVGIPEQNLSSIFDPFFTTKTVGAGTGLGLSISYGIIQKHGGSIRVTSQVNVGTEFTIELPLYLNRKNDEASPAAAG